jgi:hypothetical protein
MLGGGRRDFAWGICERRRSLVVLERMPLISILQRPLGVNALLLQPFR